MTKIRASSILVVVAIFASGVISSPEPRVGPRGAKVQYVNPDTLPDSSQFGYTQIVRIKAKEHIFVSGQIPINGSGVVPEDAIGSKARQFDLVFENLEKAIAAIPEATLDDVVSIRIYVVDYGPEADLPLVVDFDKRFGPDFPANDLIGVTSLGLKDLLVEVSATVVL